MKFSLRKFVKATKVRISAKSPELLLAGGIATGVSALVMMGKQTLKCEEILDEHQKKMDDIEEAIKIGEGNGSYTEKDASKDRAVAYAQTGFNFLKLYSPVIALSIISFGCFVGSHNILKKRNIALSAAYAAIDKAFKEYRGRVVENLGEESDQFFKYGYKKVAGKILEKDEDGNARVAEKEIDAVPWDDDGNLMKPTAFVFSKETSSHWHWDDTINKMTLSAAERTLNMDFQRDGILFLNDVLKALGMKPVSYGQYIGWCIGKGDPYIKFDIKEAYQRIDPSVSRTNPLGNDFETIYYLDFNTCGDVHEALGMDKTYGHFE